MRKWPQGKRLDNTQSGWLSAFLGAFPVKQLPVKMDVGRLVDEVDVIESMFGDGGGGFELTVSRWWSERVGFRLS